MKIVLFQTIQFSSSTQFNCQKHFYFKLFSLIKQLIQFSISTDFGYTQLNVKTVLYQTIQFSVSRVSILETVPFQTIQFSINTQSKCKYSLIVKNISFSSYSI